MRAGNGTHMYERTYNLCTANHHSIYVDTLDEVREIAAREKVLFVNKGYADSRYLDGGIEEITRRTTGSVHRRHWEPNPSQRKTQKESK